MIIKNCNLCNNIFIRIFFGLVGFLAIVGFFVGDPNQESAPTPPKQSPGFSTTSYDISNAYEKNTVAADNRFKGKLFKISGTVSDINTDVSDQAVIILQGVENTFSYPQAHLLPSEKQKAASINKGDEITLICTGNGDAVKIPMMKDCSIVQ